MSPFPFLIIGLFFITLSFALHPFLFFRLHRQRFLNSGVCGNQERSRCFGRLSLSWGLQLHQHPWGSIPERPRGSSAPVPFWTLPYLGGYSSTYSFLPCSPSFLFFFFLLGHSNCLSSYVAIALIDSELVFLPKNCNTSSTGIAGYYLNLFFVFC